MAKAKTAAAAPAPKAAKAAAAPAPKAAKAADVAPTPVAAAKPATAAAKPAKSVKQIDPQVRLRMIAEAAYYIAEKRGFIHGHHDADWAAAEKQIDDLLAK